MRNVFRYGHDLPPGSRNAIESIFAVRAVFLEAIFGLFTPKGFDSKAQGQRRSRATLGKSLNKTTTPKGLHHRFCVTLSAYRYDWASPTQGALRDPGLWNVTPSA
jgi:hypothetical protein